MKQDIKKLRKLYNKLSKHSNYQILSKRLASVLSNKTIKTRSRFETERLDYILKKIECK